MSCLAGSAAALALPVRGSGELTLMRFAKTLLFTLLTICTVPAAAQAQYATCRTIHDWKVEVGEFHFGLLESNISYAGPGPGSPITTVLFGPYRWFTIRFSAVKRAMFGFLVLLTAVALPAGLMMTRKQRTEPPG